MYNMWFQIKSIGDSNREEVSKAKTGISRGGSNTKTLWIFSRITQSAKDWNNTKGNNPTPFTSASMLILIIIEQ